MVIRRCSLLATLLVALLVPASSAQAAAKQPPIDGGKLAKGAKRMTFKFGPIHITPGQNTIEVKPNFERPKVPGYITRFSPDLKRADGSTPRVDVLHLHHGVWIVDGRPTWAAGEEKTIVTSPPGFGVKYTPKQSWLMNYMVHNLITSPDTVYLTYTIDFIPQGSREYRKITPVQTQWLDAVGGAYPVFDALRSQAGSDGKLTFPDDVPDAYGGRPPANEWTADRDLTVVQTAGHLHPGGLETYLTVRRGDRTVRAFTSKAWYWEPAGAVSWDAAMTATPKTWKLAIKKGDVLAVHGTYDVSKASWYESMAIMPLAVTLKPAGGTDPFVRSTNTPGVITHGHLPENDTHGGGAAPGLVDMTKVLDGPVADTRVTIDSFVYGQGSMSLSGMPGRPPVVQRGKSISFYNADAKKSRNIFHTITACKAPCNKATGIAYPLADGPVDFDSGELGFGPRGFTAASNLQQWDTPADLPQGLYTYFCRVHPFMRGAFRVKD